MKITIFVPIKLNSQRLPNKMLLPIGNKLLCQHIFDTLLEVKKEINVNIYCYCSDEKIINYLPNDVIFLKRNSSLDTNETKGIDIYKSFIEIIDSDVYCLCHATSPFIKKKSIIDGLNKLINEDYDSSFSVSKIQTFTWYKNKPLNYDFQNVIRTQDIEPIFWETSAFYIFKKEILNKYNRRIGFKPFMIETDRIESIDIDEKEDYDLANSIIK
jgi:CMP-N-acetylneuraminic acid synthetase